METSWILTAVGLLGAYLFSKKSLQERIRKQLDDKKDRKRYARELREDKFFPGLDGDRYGEEDYRDRLKQAISYIDRSLGSRLFFNLRGLGFCLTLSLAYCSLFFLVGWLFKEGSSVRYLAVLPTDWDGWRRGLLVLVYVLEVLGIYWLGTAFRKSPKRAVRLAAYCGLVVWWAICLVLIHMIMAGSVGEELFRFDMLAASGSLIGVIIGISSVFFVLFVSSPGPLVGYVSFGLALASLLGWVLGWFQDLDPMALLFLVVLPMINGLFDWPSWAVSRWLIKQLASEPATPKRLFLHALTDLAAALLLLLGLAATMSSTVVLLHLGIPVTEIVDEALRHPFERGSWLILMLASTLVPTALHAIVVLSSAVVCNLLPSRWREKHAEKLDPPPGRSEPSTSALDSAAGFLTMRWWAAGIVVLFLSAVLWLPAMLLFQPFGGLLGLVAKSSAEAVRSDRSATAEADALSRRSIALFDQGRHAEAMAAISKALELDPDNARALHDQSWILFHSGSIEESLAGIRRAIELEPTEAEFWYGLHATLHELGRNEEALSAAEKALELDAEDGAYHLSLALSLYNLDRHREALDAVKRATELDPRDESSHLLHGWVLQALGDSEAALDATGRAIELEPKDPWNHFSLGQIQQSLGDLQGARASMQKAVEKAPEEARFLEGLSSVLEALGQNEEAQEVRTKAEQLRSERSTPDS